jgi:hypothetical protein
MLMDSAAFICLSGCKPLFAEFFGDNLYLDSISFKYNSQDIKYKSNLLRKMKNKMKFLSSNY